MTDKQNWPKDLLELPMFHSLAQMFRSEKLMHRCEICGEYNFETEMFDDPALGWVDNKCLDAHIDHSIEDDEDIKAVIETAEMNKAEQRWEYEADIPVFDGEQS